MVIVLVAQLRTGAMFPDRGIIKSVFYMQIIVQHHTLVVVHFGHMIVMENVNFFMMIEINI